MSIAYATAFLPRSAHGSSADEDDRDDGRADAAGGADDLDDDDADTLAWANHRRWPSTTEASATLPIPARRAFDLFADASEIPAWLPMLSTSRVLLRDSDQRPTHVAFSAGLHRASIGYSLHYHYDLASLRIAWATGANATIQIAGSARFTALGDEACLMHYQVSVGVPAIAPWQDSRFTDHAASAVVAAFRDYIRR